jgi:transmembrane sensor
MVDPKNIRLQELANKILKGTITPSEQAEFDIWFNTETNEKLVIGESIAKSEGEHAKILLDRINAKIDKAGNTNQYYRLWKIIAVSAAAVLLIGFGTFILFNKSIRYQIAINKMQKIGPGGHNAVLTLASGQQIILNNTKNGVIGNQGASIVFKTNNNQISYKSPAGTESLLSYNTITIPNGGEFQVVLPDGTKVWLNSASSLKYPIAFTGKERKVTLTGEAYFEVAKNKEMPFKVQTADQVVEVLGTHFNINAYENEPLTKTTLLEGSVKISSAGGEALGVLHPGQQSILNKGEIAVSDADTAQAVAWKNGFFYFNNADIASIMRALARWYDIDVVFDGQIPQRRFSGRIYRNVNAAEMLEIINYSDINYEVEDSKDGHTKIKLVITP